MVLPKMIPQVPDETSLSFHRALANFKQPHFKIYKRGKTAPVEAPKFTLIERLRGKLLLEFNFLSFLTICCFYGRQYQTCT